MLARQATDFLRFLQFQPAVQLIKATPVHYGWVILAAGTFGSFMTLPGQTAGVSVFFDPITTHSQISRTSASIAYAAGTLAGILPAPLIGRWIDKRGPRLTATIIAGGSAMACIWMAFVEFGDDAARWLRAPARDGDRRAQPREPAGRQSMVRASRRGIAAAAASLGLVAASWSAQPIDFLISLYGLRAVYRHWPFSVALTICWSRPRCSATDLKSSG